MAFWCYILRCSDGKYYTGHTDDLERRLAEQHNGGYCEFTSRRRPVALLWAQDFPTQHEALQSELTVKKWSRAKKEALARSDWQALLHFAKSPWERSTGTPPIGVSTSLDTNGDGEQ
jgi:predicted GIY-YIG superfamily endonuclease